MVYICVYIEYTKMEGTHDKDKKRGRVRVIVAYRQYWVVFYILRIALLFKILLYINVFK